MPIFCSHCAYENDVHYRFCGMCGTPLSNRATEETRDDIQADGVDRYSREGTLEATTRTEEHPPLADEYPAAEAARHEAPRTPVAYSYEGSPSQRLRESLRSTPLPQEDTRIIEPQRRFDQEDTRNSAQRPVSGPSFLGLSGPAQPDVNYLLEEDVPSTGRRRMGLALLILLIAAAALGWRWYHTGLPWTSNKGSSAQNIAGGSAQPSYSENGAPLPGDNATHVEKPKTGVGDTAELQPSDAPAITGKPRETDLPASNSHSAPANTDSGRKSEITAEALDNSEKTSPDADQSTPAPPPLPTVRPVSRPETTVPKRAAIAEAPPAPVDAEALTSEGEKYLYGTGVSQNCALAQKDLLTAAGKSNAHAQTLLGAMHATGHCVDRDLPSAYRWFAKALHGDPKNTRIERDLEILWKQMTPEEKQLASAKQ